MRNTSGDIVEFGVRCSDLRASLTQVDSLRGSGNRVRVWGGPWNQNGIRTHIWRQNRGHRKA